MKILLTGIGQANFLNQLYSKVILCNHMQVDAINLNYKSEEQEKVARKIFKNLLPEYKQKNSFSRILIPFKTKVFWKFLILNLSSGSLISFKQFKSFIAENIYHSNYANYLDNLDYDYIHHHFLSLDFGLYLLYLKHPKLIISFWGSDLFRKTSIPELFFKKKVLDQAASITVATSDMKYHVMTKFSLNFRDKIHRLKFINNNSYFQYIENVNSQYITERKSELFPGINEKKIIAFGHSGFKEDNYNDFLNSLESLAKETKSKYHILFCLTYGSDKETLIKDVKSKMDILGIDYTIVDTYVSLETLADYHCCVDAFLFMPQSDAFSGYLTECFYHNIPVFVGAWLPYKEFTRMGLKYHEINDFNEIPNVLKNMDKYFENDYSQNKSIIKKYFIDSDDSYNWSKLYKEWKK